jgi:hypothetical protein
LKEYHLNWKTIPQSGSVYYKGFLKVKASSFEEAIKKAEKIIRAKSKRLLDVPLEITEKGATL